MDCTLDKLGRTVAFTTVEFREPETDRLLARGSHTKYVGNILKHVSNYIAECFDLVLTKRNLTRTSRTDKAAAGGLLDLAVQIVK